MRLLKYLTERGSSSEGRSVGIEASEAKKIIKEKCGKILKAYQDGKTQIWRGVSHGRENPFMMIDTTGTERMSRNTGNYYTLVINKAPNWSKFPKRNIICTTLRGMAISYGSRGGDAYLMFPYDDTDIGVCLFDDIWYSWDIIRGYNAQDLNHKLEELGIRDDSWSDLVASCKAFDSGYEEAKESYTHIERVIMMGYKGNMIDHIAKHIFPPKGFKVVKAGSNLPGDNEVWFDGQAVMVRMDMSSDILNS